MEKLLSVIIPIYNVEQYLERCVRSVVYQTYQNLEIILVDDGSTDKSGSICDLMNNKYSRIKVIHKKNGGLSDARNCGIDAATGEYIAFLDSDDYIHREMYSILIHRLEQYDADIAECRFVRCWDFQTDKEEECRGFFEATAKEALIENVNRNRFANVVWNKVYKTELLDGLRFPIGKIHEDLFFTYKAFGTARKLVSVENKMCYYHQRDNSITGSGITKKSVSDLIEALKERLSHDKKNDKELYDLNQKKFTSSLYFYLDRCVFDKRPWKVKKQPFYILAQELSESSDDILLSSPKRRFLIKVLRKSKFLFRIVYSAYTKFKGNE